MQYRKCVWERVKRLQCIFQTIKRYMTSSIHSFYGGLCEWRNSHFQRLFTLFYYDIWSYKCVKHCLSFLFPILFFLMSPLYCQLLATMQNSKKHYKNFDLKNSNRQQSFGLIQSQHFTRLLHLLKCNDRERSQRKSPSQSVFRVECQQAALCSAHTNSHPLTPSAPTQPGPITETKEEHVYPQYHWADRVLWDKEINYGPHPYTSTQTTIS